MINGVLNVRKEAGFTSHDVVAKLRGILHQKKIGHTGTLDPDAVGVLPVCLGKGTKLCDMLTDETKTYETVLHLGISTDTQDISGQVTASAPVEVTPEEVHACIREFEGEQLQIPPMYSALKVNGRKLYELAREGQEIEREARRVHFYEIKILEMKLPLVRMEVTCSKGTYIRTLCHDIGERLGCHGCMEQLTRTRVGRFSLASAHTLNEIAQIVEQNRLEEILVPVDGMFSRLRSCMTTGESERLAANGNAIPVNLLKTCGEETPETLTDQEQFRLYDGGGSFVGIYQYNAGQEICKPVKMFLERT